MRCEVNLYLEKSCFAEENARLLFLSPLLSITNTDGIDAISLSLSMTALGNSASFQSQVTMSMPRALLFQDKRERTDHSFV
jgi:hypothetical protein